MSKVIKIISTQKIDVQRELAYVDRSPDLTKQGSFVAVGGGDLVRVNTLVPIIYPFKKGTNEVPDPLPPFIDPITREKISDESILSWAGVKHLIEAGVFEAYKPDQKISAEDLSAEKPKKKKSIEEISQSSN